MSADVTGNFSIHHQLHNCAAVKFFAFAGATNLKLSWKTDALKF